MSEAVTNHRDLNMNAVFIRPPVTVSPWWPTTFCLVAVVCCFASGCRARLPETAPVSGRVTCKGQPVTTGRIVFYPAKGRAAMGTIGPDGKYTLTTFSVGDGAILGKQGVTIESTRSVIPPGPKSYEEEMRGAAPPAAIVPVVQWLVPEKYSQQSTSPLTAEVQHGPNTIDFELP